MSQPLASQAPRVLVLGSYPVTQPRHGGQIRLAQIVQAYRARGMRVHLATYFPANTTYLAAPRGPGDVALPADRLQSWRGHVAPFIEDLASGEFVAADEARVQTLERQAGACDIVHLEQPWLLPLVLRLRARGRLGAFRLVYGSQNIEHRLKRAIFEQYRVQDGEPLLQAIESLEREAACESDGVAAVTREDANVLSAWTGRPVVLAANGIQPWASDAAEQARWRERLGPQPFALYVASAHPPNIVGFCESFGTCLAALAPGQRVVLAGSVAEPLLASPWYREWDALNQRRVVSVGPVSDRALSALRDLAHTFVLPMTSGEGSNLKSAEALYAGRWVVATPHAMRGFEAFAQAPRVRVCEPGPAFGQAVCHTLSQPVPDLDAAQDAQRKVLTWDHTLAALCQALVEKEVAA